MRTPMPGFVGSRLREARQVRGLQAVQLAELLDVTASSISGYETGKSRPSIPVAESIATKLNMPVQFFTQPARPARSGRVFYRSMAAATKGARERASYRQLWLQDIVGHLDGMVEFPTVNLPDLDVPRDPLLLSDEEIEDLALATRRHWRMDNGPVANVVNVLENHGVITAADRLGADTLDGLSVHETDGRPYVMIGTDKGASARWRFDAAHELGHVILHRHVDPRLLTTSEHHKRIESQAHRFAAAFLLPMPSFAAEFYAASLDVLVEMKPRWGTSIAMMIKRARTGGFTSESYDRTLWINYARRGWRKNEPLDDVLPAERPQLVANAIRITAEQRPDSVASLRTAVALSDSDIETLTALPSGYLRGAESALPPPGVDPARPRLRLV